jgi:hypothetical protein
MLPNLASLLARITARNIIVQQSNTSDLKYYAQLTRISQDPYECQRILLDVSMRVEKI